MFWRVRDELVDGQDGCLFLGGEMTVATAPGKVILFGEHAVVYGQPAVAVPVTQVRATATVSDSSRPGVYIIAPDLAYEATLAEMDEQDALAVTLNQFQVAAGLAAWPNLTITVSSGIPIASGLGSGAAIAAAMIRALALHLHRPELTNKAQLSALTYQVEKVHHGTPSGIDNTVVAYEQPVYFIRQQPQNYIEPLVVSRPVHLLVADTGVRSSTKVVVGDVRRQWQADPTTFETIFAACGQIAVSGREALEQGNLPKLGQLMNENHLWLQKMSVSSPELDTLVQVAQTAGAIGAKLSGAGRGGNMIVLIKPEQEEQIRQTLLAAGATNVLSSIIGK